MLYSTENGGNCESFLIPGAVEDFGATFFFAGMSPDKAPSGRAGFEVRV